MKECPRVNNDGHRSRTQVANRVQELMQGNPSGAWDEHPIGWRDSLGSVVVVNFQNDAHGK